MKDAILKWLQLHISAHRLVQKVFLFGSFSKERVNFNDVDAVVVFIQKNVRSFLARIKRQFYVTFHKRLHLQIFHIEQHNLIESFLLSAGKLIEV